MIWPRYKDFLILIRSDIGDKNSGNYMILAWRGNATYFSARMKYFLKKNLSKMLKKSNTTWYNVDMERSAYEKPSSKALSKRLKSFSSHKFFRQKAGSSVQTGRWASQNKWWLINQDPGRFQGDRNRTDSSARSPSSHRTPAFDHRGETILVLSSWLTFNVRRKIQLKKLSRVFRLGRS